MSDWEIDLVVSGDEFKIHLLSDREEADRRQGKHEGYCVFSNREMNGLKHATGGDPLDPSMAKAICLVKKILGGTIENAYGLEKH